MMRALTLLSLCFWVKLGSPMALSETLCRVLFVEVFSKRLALLISVLTV